MRAKAIGHENPIKGELKSPIKSELKRENLSQRSQVHQTAKFESRRQLHSSDNFYTDLIFGHDLLWKVMKVEKIEGASQWATNDRHCIWVYCDTVKEAAQRIRSQA